MKFSLRIVCCLVSTAWVGAAAADIPTSAAGEAGGAAFCAVRDYRDPAVASRTIEFATMLAGRGPRRAVSGGEAAARKAVVAELEAIGLDVTTEEFEYQTFTIDTTALDLGGVLVEPVVLGLDPFANRFRFSGEAVIITDPEQASGEIEGRIVVTNHPLMQFMIAELDPAVVVTVEPGDLEDFAARTGREVSLDVKGSLHNSRSTNVVARLGPRSPFTPVVLVTSHLDAYQQSPGANDNGTGLGLMIELARLFATNAPAMDASLTFVAFGAEENGSIGSRAWVEAHADELQDIVAVVNLDTLGGALGPVIASKPTEQEPTSPARGVHVPEGLRNRAWVGPDGRWRIIHPEILRAASSTDYPEWFHEVVTRSGEDLGIEVVQLDLISDHRTFALAGVPAISIQSKEHRIHSDEDTAEALVADTIDACARLAVRILCRLQGERERIVPRDQTEK